MTMYLVLSLLCLEIAAGFVAWSRNDILFQPVLNGLEVPNSPPFDPHDVIPKEFLGVFFLCSRLLDSLVPRGTAYPFYGELSELTGDWQVNNIYAKEKISL